MNVKIKILFAIVVGIGIVLQLVVPATMILRQERILYKGTRIYFEARAVDPLDVFRGRYVEIGLAEFNRTFPDLPYSRKGSFYAIVEANEQGVATIASVEISAPEEKDILYLQVKRSWGQYLQNPFNRFYMPEKFAPVAEDIYREMSRRGEAATNSVLLAVRIHNGKTAVEDLLVNGTPMIHAAQERLKQGKQK